MRPDRSVFYVKWAQASVDFAPGKKVRDRSAGDIRSFLDDLRNRPGIEEWQVQQAEHSLKILHEQFLPEYGPAHIPAMERKVALKKPFGEMESFVRGTRPRPSP